MFGFFKKNSGKMPLDVISYKIGYNLFPEIALGKKKELGKYIQPFMIDPDSGGKIYDRFILESKGLAISNEDNRGLFKSKYFNINGHHYMALEHPIPTREAAPYFSVIDLGSESVTEIKAYVLCKYGTGASIDKIKYISGEHHGRESLGRGPSDANMISVDNFVKSIYYRSYYNVQEIIGLAEKEGEAKAKFVLAELLHMGFMVEQDNDLAITLYQDSAMLGDPDAQYVVGSLYYSGTLVGGLPGDDIHFSKEYLTKSAEQGNLEAQYLLGSLWLTGFFGKIRKEKAMKLIKSAASQHHAEAIRLLM